MSHPIPNMPKRFSLQTLTKPWNRLSVRRQGFLVIAVPLLCLIGSLGIFSWQRYSIDRSQKWVDHTNQILLESNQLLTGLLNAETGVRGYALTLSPEFLEPYQMAQSSLPSRLSRLNELVSDNPAQKQKLQNITQMMKQRVRLLVEIIEQINGADPKNLQKSNLERLVIQGKAEMDRLRISLDQFDQAERYMLKVRQDELNFQRNINEILLWVAAIVSAIGSTFTLILFSRLDHNLSERERRLRESKSLIEAIVSNVVDGVVILDQGARIESINTAAASIFGYLPLYAIGQDLSLLLNDIPSAASHSSREHWVEQLMNRGQQWQTTGRHSSGESFPVEISISQISLDQRMILIIRDVTEQQQVTAQLQARAEELTQLNATLALTNTELQSRNQELDQFAYVASHDLKAPLRAIASLSEWVEEDLAERLPEENKRQIHLLRSRVKRMEALLNGLLQYSRIGRTQIPIETVDVGALLEEIVDTLAPPPTFTIEIGLDMPIIRTRRLALRQVLANLLENAHKHHPRADGNVKVSVTDQGRWYEFVIEDDGNGIDPHYHDKIFTIFQTLKSRDAHENTGIGLSIIKKILETEGGSIRLESKEGEGATFRFTWLKSPLVQGNSPKPPALEGQTM
jgi:PAS domain S-box-containing protein